jgi:YVTN family beta-propeller protein
MGSLQNIVAVGKYRIYVANQTTGTVVLISPSTNTVVATIPVSASANSPLGLTVVYEPFFSEDNDILATNPDDETISVINKYSSVIDTIAVGHGPYALLIELK